MANTRASTCHFSPHIPLSLSLYRSLYLSVSVCLHFGTRLGKHGVYTMCHSFSRARFVANLNIETRFNSILFNFYFIATFSLFLFDFVRSAFVLQTLLNSALQFKLKLRCSKMNVVTATKKISLSLKMARQKPAKFQ